MSHESNNHHPMLAMPGGHKLDTLLVCPDGKCGRCVRCEYLSTSKQLVAKGLATEMANGALDKMLREEQALSILRRECIRTMADGIKSHDHHNSGLKKALMELVDMTPAEALVELNRRTAAEAVTEATTEG